jgi:hypothetical protein
VGLSPTPSPKPTATNGNGSGLPSSTPTIGLTPGSGDNQNSTVPDNNTSSNASTQNPPFLILGSLAAGLLLLIAVAVFLVKKLLEPMMDPVILPPSGARPWSRTPGPSMDGATNLYSWGNTTTNTQAWANDPFAEATPPPFANQNPSLSGLNMNGFPLTPEPSPTTGTQWGMPPGDISIPVYAQNGGISPIMPPNTGFPTLPPPPGYQGNYVVGDPSYNEDQPSFNTFEGR